MEHVQSCRITMHIYFHKPCFSYMKVINNNIHVYMYT